MSLTGLSSTQATGFACWSSSVCPHTLKCWNMTGLRNGDAIVITGAAQGIGRAIAVELARRGAKLALWDVLVDGLAQTEKQCVQIGVDVITRRVDVSDTGQIALAAEEAIAHFDGVFGLVNNAGIFPRAPILEATPELWRTVLGVNLLGTVF